MGQPSSDSVTVIRFTTRAIDRLFSLLRQRGRVPMAHSSIFIVRLLLGFALAAVMAAASTIAGMPDPVLWPQPQRLQSGSNVLAVSSKFSVQCKSSSPIVQNAVQRYTAIIANTKYVRRSCNCPVMNCFNTK